MTSRPSPPATPAAGSPSPSSAWPSPENPGVGHPPTEEGFQIRNSRFIMIWNLESGIWNLESGIWNLESGIPASPDAMSAQRRGHAGRAVTPGNPAHGHEDVAMPPSRSG